MLLVSVVEDVDKKVLITNHDLKYPAIDTRANVQCKNICLMIVCNYITYHAIYEICQECFILSSRSFIIILNIKLILDVNTKYELMIYGLKTWEVLHTRFCE